tara:strand:+ start:333 stop:557 length:225 start_codon:yes stop_codon:yes gene_type:complete
MSQTIDYLSLWEDYKTMSISKGYTYHISGTFMFFNQKTGDIIQWINPEKKHVKLHSQTMTTNVQFTEVEEIGAE